MQGRSSSIGSRVRRPWRRACTQRIPADRWGCWCVATAMPLRSLRSFAVMASRSATRGSRRYSIRPRCQVSSRCCNSLMIRAIALRTFSFRGVRCRRSRSCLLSNRIRASMTRIGAHGTTPQSCARVLLTRDCRWSSPRLRRRWLSKGSACAIARESRDLLPLRIASGIANPRECLSFSRKSPQTRQTRAPAT